MLLMASSYGIYLYTAMYRVLTIENKMLEEGMRILQNGGYERLLKLSE